MTSQPNCYGFTLDCRRVKISSLMPSPFIYLFPLLVGEDITTPHRKNRESLKSIRAYLRSSTSISIKYHKCCSPIVLSLICLVILITALRTSIVSLEVESNPKMKSSLIPNRAYLLRTETQAIPVNNRRLIGF